VIWLTVGVVYILSALMVGYMAVLPTVLEAMKDFQLRDRDDYKPAAKWGDLIKGVFCMICPVVNTIFAVVAAFIMVDNLDKAPIIRPRRGDK
jgi:hypothetical protein